MKTTKIRDYNFPFPVKELYSLNELDRALQTIADGINSHYSDQILTVMNVLQGGTVTTANLLLKLRSYVVLDSIYVTRYKNQTQGYELEWKQYPSTHIKDQIVVLVDDIFDEGVTLFEVKKYCLEQGAKEVKTVVLLNKEHNRKVHDFSPDYIGLSIPDSYVFGYGLDYEGLHRNAPGIFCLAD